MKDAKKIVEWLCCDCNRYVLNAIAARCGYKNPEKFNRGKVDQIAYIDKMLLDGDRRYQIIDAVTNDILVKSCSRKYVVDYVMRECQFSWCREDTVPVKNDTRQALRIVPVS